MKRLFIDMDGTLATFNQIDKIESLYEEGYFYNLKPYENVIKAVKDIIKENKEIDVYILSAYLSDSDYALKEKNAWLDKYLPEITKKKRLFLPCGENKKNYIPNGVTNNDYLLDDYTKNLFDFDPPGIGIKLLNNINHTKGTWLSNKIRFDRTGEDIKNCIEDIVIRGRKIQDEKYTDMNFYDEEKLYQEIEKGLSI